MDKLDEVIKLANGDILRFRVVEDKEDGKRIFVTDGGDIDVPYLGPVKAVGKTCRQLAQEVKLLLEKDLYNHATVIIGVESLLKKNVGFVYINGAIRGPGRVDLPTDEDLTVSKAILKAGGFTDFANKTKVRVSRKLADGKIEDSFVDVAAVTEKGKVDKDMKLENGDTIYVSSRLVNF